MNIVFLTEFNIENQSGASFNRIIELSKAFNAATGKPVYIASLMMDNANPDEKILVEEFPVYLIGETKKCDKNFFSKRYLLHNEKFEELKRIVNYFEAANIKPVFVIYNFFTSVYDHILFIKYLKNRGFKVLSEKNERALGSAKTRSYPQVIHKRITFIVFQLIEIINGFFIDRYFTAFDGFLTINENYKCFISRKVPDTPVLKIPILYKEGNNRISEKKAYNNLLTIGYFGTINFKRDKIGLILKALCLLKEDYNLLKIRFTIGGKASMHEEARLLRMVKQLDLSQIVNYVGYLNNEDLETQLEKQNILLALRNNSMQGEYSFATKIAMYMQMGKIPLVSDVSDNSLYINNGVNGFILPNTDPDYLARQLFEISKIQEKALNDISLEAQRTAQKHFNYKSYVDDLKSFLNEI